MPFSDKNRQKAHNRFYYLVNKKGLTEEKAGEQVKKEMDEYKRAVPMNEMDILLRAKTNNKMTTKQKIRYNYLTKKEDEKVDDSDDKILNKLSSINNSLYYETDPDRREKLIKIKNSLYEML